MIRLTMTDAIVQAMNYCNSNGILGWPSSTIEGEPVLDEPRIGNPISHGQIIDLNKCLKEHTKKTSDDSTAQSNTEIPPYYLDTLLRGSQVYIEPPKPKPEPTSEYKALMARLRKEEEARYYERMMNPPGPIPGVSTGGYANSKEIHISGREAAEEDDEMTFADINRQVAVIFNVLLSIVACSVALWMVARRWSVPLRLGLSMSGGGLVGVAEVVIYLGYLRRVTEAKNNEKKKVEKTEVVETWVIERSSNNDDEKEISKIRRSKTEPAEKGLRQRAVHWKDS